MFVTSLCAFLFKIYFFSSDLSKNPSVLKTLSIEYSVQIPVMHYTINKSYLIQIFACIQHWFPQGDDSCIFVNEEEVRIIIIAS